MNEVEDLGVHMKPGFAAFFAFLFAVSFGAVWEIFEFAMDVLFGMNMQKEVLGNPSGLMDTMWDLIVDAIGTLGISLLGWRYLHRRRNESFLESWIAAFVRSNPRLFRQRD